MVYVAANPVVKIHDVAFVKFVVPDFEKERSFFIDFGLQVDGACSTNDVCYLKGRGYEPACVIVERGPKVAFGGLGLRVRDYGDLEKLAAKFSTSVDSVDKGPWNSATKVVRLRDPDGFHIEVLAGGVELNAPQAAPAREPLNEAAGLGYRRKNQLKRMEPQSSRVVRLGHIVLGTSSFVNAEKWYKDNFGLITSDEVMGPQGPKGPSLGAFMRCDRGDEPTDHHTFFLIGLPPNERPHFNHAAFEVVDFDDLMVGNTFLKNKHAEHSWGVGRHVLGSQIFDYWTSPAGFTVEHWTDGDLLNKSFGSNVAPLKDLMDTQVGRFFGGLRIRTDVFESGATPFQSPRWARPRQREPACEHNAHRFDFITCFGVVVDRLALTWVETPYWQLFWSLYGSIDPHLNQGPREFPIFRPTCPSF